jgi:hypothetical protein
MDKIAGAIIGTVGAIGGIMDAHSMSTRPDLSTQQSSHYERRFEERNRSRSRSRRADTTAKGYRQRGSSQQVKKPAHLDHRYNG